MALKYTIYRHGPFGYGRLVPCGLYGLGDMAVKVYTKQPPSGTGNFGQASYGNFSTDALHLSQRDPFYLLILYLYIYMYIHILRVTKDTLA